LVTADTVTGCIVFQLPLVNVRVVGLTLSFKSVQAIVMTTSLVGWPPSLRLIVACPPDPEV